MKQKVNPESNYPICTRCNSKTPRVDDISISQLTAKASYWRNMPDKIRICPKCSEELSNIVNEWWLKKGKSKFV